MLCSLSRCIGTTFTPGVDIGTMNIEMPLCFFTSGSVRVASHT